MTGSDKPRFEHHCETCRFVGHAHGHDLYVCFGEWDSGSVIARYGPEGQYASQPIDLLMSSLSRGFNIGDRTQPGKEVTTHVPFTSTALLILALALAREKGITRWEVPRVPVAAPTCTTCKYMWADGLDMESPRCSRADKDIDDVGERPQWCPLHEAV